MDQAAPPATIDLHATTVALGARALVIRGRSGSGKSALALELLAYGCDLVADDRTRLAAAPDGLRAAAPAGLPPLIEARGLGLLAATLRADVPVAAILDLDLTETDRLPPRRETTLLGHALPLLHKPGTGPFAASLLQYLKAGRRM